MKRTRASLLRRAAVWTAGALLVVSVAAWAISMFGLVHIAPRCGWNLHIWRGVLVVDRLPDSRQPGWYAVGPSLKQAGWCVPKLVLSDTTGMVPPQSLAGVLLPFWVPTTIAGLLLASAYALGLRGRAWERAGRCASCAYDLTGINGPCPECGSGSPGSYETTSSGAPPNEDCLARRSAP